MQQPSQPPPPAPRGAPAPPRSLLPDVVFGAADGLIVATGIVTGCALAGHWDAIWAGAFSAGLAEFPGMASGRYQSAPQDGIAPALANGGSACAAATLPAVPFLFLPHPAAVAVALAIGLCVCALTTVAGPGRGWAALARSFGITLAAAALVVAGSHVPT